MPRVANTRLPVIGSEQQLNNASYACSSSEISLSNHRTCAIAVVGPPASMAHLSKAQMRTACRRHALTIPPIIKRSEPPPLRKEAAHGRPPWLALPKIKDAKKLQQKLLHKDKQAQNGAYKLKGAQKLNVWDHWDPIPEETG